MISLNEEQRIAVEHVGHAVVTACPGSGKTRVLTARAARGLCELRSSKERVVAMTFTNRAAHEIQARLDVEDIPIEMLWAGTIHSFALDWVLRPYAPYIELTKLGFTVADEVHTERLLDELKAVEGLERTDRISTSFSRDGADLNHGRASRAVFRRYKEKLREEKLIDYDDVLYLAFHLLEHNREIASNLASIFRLICVDEVQDVQDLQFGILSSIFQSAVSPPLLFFVGDPDQSIYESLGALTKTPLEIAAEFGLDEITHLRLAGNYRSRQRLIDFYRRLRPGVPTIESQTEYALEHGRITFQNQSVAAVNLVETIASLIIDALATGIAASEICVLAPHWWHVRSLARGLVGRLPEVEFDAPGLSPLYSAHDNFWFKVGRLFLTSPSPRRTRTRIRWAREVLSELVRLTGETLPDGIDTPRRLLRVVNRLSSESDDGLTYLRDVFAQLLVEMEIDLNARFELETQYHALFERAEKRIADSGGEIPTDIDSYRRFFRHPSGVVVSTCHAVKGEEYETVIAFALLRGYVPNWEVLINGTREDASERESKLLYVISSRAKRRLHLIAESGRRTRNGNPYETSRLLQRVEFDYDPIGPGVN